MTQPHREDLTWVKVFLFLIALGTCSAADRLDDIARRCPAALSKDGGR